MPATILIVDDEPQNCKLLEALLHPEGYLTVTADSGAQALREVASRAPDLILLDVMMPEMDGYQVASLLKANPLTSHIPIIMVTALSERDACLASLEVGAQEFLNKPVDRAELWLRVRNLLRLKEYSDFLRDHNLRLEEEVLARTAELQQSIQSQLSEAARQVAVLNSLPAHIALLDSQGRIVSVNHAWRNFDAPNLLLNADYGPGTDYLRVCDAAQGTAEARRVAPGLRSVLDGGTDSFTLEYPCHSPSQRRWFLLTVTPLYSDHLGGVIVMHLDVSARKQAQEALQLLNEQLEDRVRKRTDQLQLANQELEAFSYSASHDLRTPLIAIGGFSSLLAKELGPSASERSQRYLSRIRAGAIQMGELIDALLSLAQVSRSQIAWDVVDLSAMARSTLDGYREREPKREATVTVQPDIVVTGDHRLLRQVMDNLIGNAWKFSSRSAQSSINFSCTNNSTGESVYTVQDNGAGFDMAYANKLFSAFQRLHTESEFAGTGIGLATVHRIIGRHGGRVWAESAPGQGATFYFTLGSTPA